jgi:hypothetical protein
LKPFGCGRREGSSIAATASWASSGAERGQHAAAQHLGTSGQRRLVRRAHRAVPAERQAQDPHGHALRLGERRGRGEQVAPLVQAERGGGRAPAQPAVVAHVEREDVKPQRRRTSASSTT